MCSISNLLSLQALQGCILTHAEIQTIQQRIRKDMTFYKTFSQTPGVNWIYMLISNKHKPSAHIQNRTQNLRNSVKDTKMKVNNFYPSLMFFIPSFFKKVSAVHICRRNRLAFYFMLSICQIMISCKESTPLFYSLLFYHKAVAQQPHESYTWPYVWQYKNVEFR